jgi:hypothetical protein
MPVLRWPLSALLSWLLAWGAVWLSGHLGWAGWRALAVGLAVASLLAALQRARWRRAIVALGFPVSALALGLPADWPAWLWALPLLLVWAVYPRRAWRDAPVFPTPAGSLEPLASHLQLPPTSRVLDAGSGAGDGLRELCRALPGAAVEGIESSLALRLLSRLRVPAARVHAGDMWQLDWAPYQLVYLFQRPESMAPAWRKAQTQMAPGSWLVSLDFAIPDVSPRAKWQISTGQTVWVYRTQGR